MADWDWSKIRDSRLVQVLVVYLAGGWAVLEAIGLLVDAFVQSRIHKARDNAVATRDRVEEILRDLDRRHAGIGAELEEVRSRRQALVEGSG